MLFHVTLFVGAFGAEICANDQCANKIVKEEAMVMMQEASRRGGLAVVDHKKHTERQDSIQGLMHSTSNLLRTGVTPDVGSFAKATIDSIEKEAIPAMQDEQKKTVELLESEFAHFGKIQTMIDAAKSQVVVLTAQESKTKEKHTLCRTEQQAKYDASTKCNSTLAELWTAVEGAETLVDNSFQAIHGSWCEGTPDGLSEDYYKSNVERFNRYIDRTEKAATAWAAYNATFPGCKEAAEQLRAQTKLCDTQQDELEASSCARANFVFAKNGEHSEEWSEAVSAYKKVVKTSLEMGANRTKEYTGIQIVKCLLANINDNVASGEPCNEKSHPDKVKSQVNGCHTLKVDASSYEIKPKETPPTPKPLDQDPYPCGLEYLEHIGYKTLPKNALSKMCQRTTCSVDLPGLAVIADKAATDDASVLKAD